MNRHFWLLLFFLPLAASAQFTSRDFTALDVIPYNYPRSMGEGMFLVEETGKAGIIDRHGKLIFPYQFDLVNAANKPYYPRYKGGKAVMFKGGKAGVVDNQGKVLVPFQYDDARLESAKALGLVTFKNISPDSYGFVDFAGKQIVPNIFQAIQEFPSFLMVQGGKMWGMMNKKGDWLIQPEYRSMFVDKSGKWVVLHKEKECFLFDAMGKLVFKSDTAAMTMYMPSEGLITAKKGGKNGYVNTKGDWVIPAQFDYVSLFGSDGVAVVGNQKTDGPYRGLIDRTGKVIVPLQHKKMGYEFNSKLIEAEDPTTGLIGYINTTGKWAINPIYLKGDSFDSFGGTWVQKANKSWVYIDASGKEVGGMTDGSRVYFGADGFAIFEKPGGKMQIIDQNGKTVKLTPLVKAFGNISEDRIRFQSTEPSYYMGSTMNLIGYMDLNGDTICAAQYGLSSQDFSDGMAMVQAAYSQQYGFINASGKLVIPIIYDTITSFVDGWALYKKNGQFGLIDKTGKEASLPRTYKWMGERGGGVIVGKTFGIGIPGWRTYYIDAATLKEFLTVDHPITYGFKGDYAIIQKEFGTSFYLMNRKGVLSERIDTIDNISGGTDGMYPTHKRFGNYGYVNVQGKWAIPPIYKVTREFKNGLGKVQDLKTDKWGLVDKTGKEVSPLKFSEINLGEDGTISYQDRHYWGVADKTGKVLLYPQFDFLSNFSKGRAIAKPGPSRMLAKSPLMK